MSCTQMVAFVEDSDYGASSERLSSVTPPPPKSDFTSSKPLNTSSLKFSSSSSSTSSKEYNLGHSVDSMKIQLSDDEIMSDVPSTMSKPPPPPLTSNHLSNITTRRKKKKRQPPASVKNNLRKCKKIKIENAPKELTDHGLRDVFECLVRGLLKMGFSSEKICSLLVLKDKKDLDDTDKMQHMLELLSSHKESLSKPKIKIEPKNKCEGEDQLGLLEELVVQNKQNQALELQVKLLSKDNQELEDKVRSLNDKLSSTKKTTDQSQCLDFSDCDEEKATNGLFQVAKNEENNQSVKKTFGESIIRKPPRKFFSIFENGQDEQKSDWTTKNEAPPPPTPKTKKNPLPFEGIPDADLTEEQRFERQMAQALSLSMEEMEQKEDIKDTIKPTYQFEAEVEFAKKISEQAEELRNLRQQVVVFEDLNQKNFKERKNDSKKLQSLEKEKATLIRKASKVDEVQEELDLVQNCGFCEEKKKDALFDCGHVWACHECASKLDRCPICNAEIRKIDKIYI